jgi:4Fe-4S ferredoxin
MIEPSAPLVLRPEIDQARCEGKAECVRVCPENVFEVRDIDPADYARLSWLGKMKSRAHGGRTAYAPNADACKECGLCVGACPEDAIQLQATRAEPAPRLPRSPSDAARSAPR